MDLNSRDLNSNNIHTLDLTKPVLFVDLGYMLFYKFYSTRTWYRCRHYDENIPKDTKWDKIEEFTNMYKNKFFDKLEKIIKKYNVPYSNIIIARDCRRCNIWRMGIYPKYKGTREESHRRCGFNGHKLFNYTTTKLIPDFIKRTGALLFHYNDTEADDIIAIVARHEHYKDWQKIIISSDKDFFQLCDESTAVYRPIQKALETEGTIVYRFGIHPNNFALARAIAGDPSDNLKGVNRVGLKTIAKNFPFLSEKKQYDSEDIFKTCENVEKKNAAHRNILAQQDVVNQNYALMQLYNPSISLVNRKSIDYIIASFERDCNNLNFKKMLFDDDQGSLDFTDLWNILKNIER